MLLHGPPPGKAAVDLDFTNEYLILKMLEQTRQENQTVCIEKSGCAVFFDEQPFFF